MSRIDAFIIWGHGLKYRDKIIARLRQQPNLELLRLQKYIPDSIDEFVDQIYGSDTVPLEHLAAKTEYLRSTPNEVFIIFARNNRPDEQLVGEGAFRHIQCMHIKQIKEELRDTYNPRQKGKRTEDHIIHATDYESQTEDLMQLLGLANGVAWFDAKPNRVLHAPYHLQPFEKARILKLKPSNLYARINKPGKEIHDVVPVQQTPHAKFVAGKPEEYTEYLEEFFGTKLVDDHSEEKFSQLIKDFEYMKPGLEHHLVLASEDDHGRLVIEDGLHRAAVLAENSTEQVPIAVVERT